MRIVIIGFSAAGVAAAEAIQRVDPSAQITILSGEKRKFYLRLDLEGLFFDKTADQLQPRSDEYWQEKGITVVHARAERIDCLRDEVWLDFGRAIGFDRLLIATGAKPRNLKVPGQELAGISHYHTLEDVERILQTRSQIQRAVIIGGGILGLEMAYIAHHLGWYTTLLVRGSYLGAPLLDAVGGDFLRKSVERAGVEILFDEEATAFEGQHGILTAVRTSSGQVLDTNFASICIGVEPDVGFLHGAGLLENGQLIVNERLETTIPGIYAAGDAVIVRKSDGTAIPCFTWSVASSEGRAAGANICGADTEWKPEILYDLDTLFDQDFALIGDWQQRHRPGRIIHEIRGDDHCRALVTCEGVLESAFLLGDRTGDKILRKLIAGRAKIKGDVRRIFEPGTNPDDYLKVS
jgi:NAD(P)H-nitrite reductase large subunit